MSEDRIAGRRFYGIAEIADALGVDRQLVTVWRRRSSHGMPRPDDELAAGPLWLAETIEPWIRQNRQRIGREAAGEVATPELLRRVARRMLRLAALLLEESWRPSEIAAAAGQLEVLSPTLRSVTGESDATRRLLAEVADLADRTQRIPRRSSAPDQELVAHCLRLAQQLSRVVTRADGDPP